MSDALYQKLFQGNRGIRYTISTPEDLFPTVLRALDIGLFPAEAIDSLVLRKLGPGNYPLIYTQHEIVSAVPVECEQVLEWTECFREHVTRSHVWVAFLKHEDHRRLPHIMKVLFPSRNMISRSLDKRMIEYVLDFHSGERWAQIDICHSPLVDNRFAA
jgi:hypothetical protein